MNTQNNNGGKGLLKLLLLVGMLSYVIGASLLSYSFEQGPNNRNVSVDTRVNITNSLPEVLSVFINGGDQNLTLNAGTYLTVECNASIRDYNGGATIENVSATFFANTTSTWNASNDNNTHYTNSSCSGDSPSGYDRNFTCTFRVQYHADVGFWACNVTATDNYAFLSVSPNASLTNYTFIDPLLALNVTTLIDYGDLAVGDTSSEQEANVTNIGNQNINVSVQGYGLNFSDGLAFVCEVGNISVQHEKYNLIGGVDLSLYTNLTSSLVQIGGLTIPQQTNDSQQNINTTYWILYVPPNPFGVCNGTVVFQAESAS